jgi:beta-carotene 3-hydroxylase
VTRALLWIPVALVTAVAMDAWAAILHRVAWHGPLWSIHGSHHRARRGRFEANDALSLLHAPLAVALILYGCAGPEGPLREVLFGLGLGMTAFGLAYVVVHDGLVHGRLPVRRLLAIRALREVVDAHRIHHARHHADPRGGPPYGFFFGPRELRARRATLTPPPSSAGPRSTTPDPPPSGSPPTAPSP